MGDLRSGMSAAKLTEDTGARWVTSTYSGPTGGNCVAVAFLADGHVAVRNSRHPGGLALVFPAAGWAVFTAAAKAGAFG